MSEDTTLWSLTADAEEALAAIDEVVGGLDELDATISSTAEAAPELDAIGESLAGMSESAGGLDSLLAGLAEAIQALTEQASAAAEALGNLGTTSDDAAGQLDAMAGSADAAAGSLDTLSASAEAAAASSNAASDAAAGWGESFGKMRMPLLLAGAAVVGLSAVAVHMAGDFQESMTQLVTGAGESASNLQTVSNGILAMSSQVGESTSQLSQGMYMIESAGYHGAAALNVLKDAAEGAKVGASDLGTVADAVTTVLNDYGAQGITAAAATNALIATVASGKTHMQDLASSLAQILPTASAASVHLTDVMGAMATMTAEGIPAAQAATYLRQTILALDSPSKLAVTTLADVGLTTQQVATTMQQSLPSAIGMITEAVGKKFPVGSAAYVKALKDIAGGSRTMQGLLDLSASHLAVFKQNVQNVTGVVKQGGNSIQGWALTQEDFNTKMGQAGATVQVAMMKIGAALMPVATALVQHLVPALQRFSTWASTHGPQIVQIVEVLAGAIGGGLATALTVATVAFVAANAPAVAIVAAVMALSAGVMILIQHWKQITDFFQSTTAPALAIKAALLGIAAAVLASLAPAIASFALALPGIIAGFIAWAASAATAAAATIAAAAPFILIGLAVAAVAFGILMLITHFKQVVAWLGHVKDAIGVFLGHVGAAIGSFFSGVGSAVQSGLARIRAFFQAGFAFIGNIVSTVIHGIVGLFKWLFDHNTYFHNLVKEIELDFKFIAKVATAIWNGIVGFLTGVWHFISGAAQAVWHDITVYIRMQLARAHAIIMAVWNGVTSFLGGIWRGIQNAASGAWNGLVGIVSSFVGKAGGAAKSVGDAILSPITNLGSALFNAGKELMQMLVNGIKNMAGAVANAAKGIAGGIMNFLGFHSPAKEGPGADADQWMPNLGKMLVSGLDAQVARIRAASQRMAGAMASGLAGAGSAGSVPLPAGAGGAFASGGGMGGGDSVTHSLLAQLLAEMRSSRAPQLGAAVTPATLGTVTQNFGGVTMNGVQDINTLYRLMTEMAGQAVENGQRGATVGLGI
jgi:TP901 family phage tail tape measure protein